MKPSREATETALKLQGLELPKNFRLYKSFLGYRWARRKWLFFWAWADRPPRGIGLNSFIYLNTPCPWIQETEEEAYEALNDKIQRYKKRKSERTWTPV